MVSQVIKLKNLENNIENNNSASVKYDIEVFNLTKKYSLKQKKKEIIALKNINFKVKSGEIFGLLGPNGAGKTTMVSIFTTLLNPTSGYATILGHNILEKPWFIKENIGLMLGGDMIYNRITGYKNLKFFSKIYGVKNYRTKIDELAENFGLSKWLNQYVSTYSRGMKLKLALMRVLLIDPKILFLDEPMLGLDPNAIIEISNYIKNLKKTIFFTSHQMDIVQKLCDRIAFLKEGEILKIDTQENFRRMFTKKKKISIKFSREKNDILQSLSQLDFVSEIEKTQNEIIFFIDNENNYPELFDNLKKHHITQFNEIIPNLDDVFIKLSK